MIPLDPAALGRLWLAVLVHLWQTTLILLPVWLAARALRTAPATVLNAMWIASCLKLLLPLALLAPAVRALARQFVPDVPGLGRTALPAALTVILDPVQALAATAASASAAYMTAVFLVLTAVWLAVVAARLARLGRAQIQLARIPSVPLADAGAATYDRLRRAIEPTGIRETSLRVERGPGLPRVSGILRPRILVPDSIVRHLPVPELRAVLLHEDWHRRRRDPLRLALLGAISALLFFYPPWGLIRRRLEETGELLCDERVLRAGVDGATYGRALARALHLAVVPALQPSAAGARRGTFLRARFERIAARGRFTMKPRDRWLVAAAFAPLILCILVPACSKPEERPAAAAASSAMPAAPAVTDGQPGPDRPLSDEFIKVDEMPAVVTPPRPVYPEEERLAEAEGTVMVRARVNLQGAVDTLFVVTEVEGHPGFSAAALEAVRHATFKPALAEGKPTAVWVQIPIRFALH